MKHNQAGFSLIEVLIAAGLLAFLINFAMKKMSLQEENMSLLEKRMKARHLMDRSISRLVAELRIFPPLSRDGGRSSMAYVACFDMGGAPVESTLDTSDFVAIALKDPKETSKICGKNQFETHVVPSVTQYKSATVYILSYDRRLEKQVMVFSSELILQGSI
ncbi:type II secretion system protein [Oligoflexus tunisiensis]|uniref:type II secretion system protein n=1 Tax=Oligoflexus tunisiensis TaxID=708132 RepID=UPI00114CC4A3|nr:type II secretion system protein [Oligoflexus tunisiensis]